MKKLIALTLFIYSSCQYKSPTEIHRVSIINASNDRLITIKLKKMYKYQAMIIKENSMNDTCMIGQIKVPPRKKGKLYRTEFLNNSIAYKYVAYKANSGTLKIEHIFFDNFSY